MATGLVAYDNINGERASKGSSATNRIAGTVYATSLDLSSTITVGTATLSSSRLDPGSSGTFDIGTTTKPSAGINGNDITITSQPGSDYSGGLGPGLGGDSTLKGGTGGLGDAISVLSANGGDVYVEGGPAGANLGGGVGTDGKVNIGLSGTSEIIIGSIHMLWNVDGGGNIGYDGSTNYRPDIIRAKTSVSAGDTCTLKTDRITLNATSGDVGSPAAGDFWYNATSGKIKYRHGSTTYELADTTSSGIPNPSGKQNNDLLQYVSGSSLWDAKGGVSGDRLGKIWGGAVDLQGHLTFNADNSYDIGYDGTNYRPRTIYAGTSVVINGFSAVTKDNVGAIGLDSVKEITVGTGDTTMASYTWAANELLVTSAIEWIIVAGSDSNSQTFSFRIQYYDGASWNDLTANVTFATSNGAMIVYRVLLMMSPVSNTRAFVWGHGCSGTIDTRSDQNLGSSTFLTTANRGLRLIMRKISGSYTGIASSIMCELRGG